MVNSSFSNYIIWVVSILATIGMPVLFHISSFNTGYYSPNRQLIIIIPCSMRHTLIFLARLAFLGFLFRWISRFSPLDVRTVGDGGVYDPAIPFQRHLEILRQLVFSMSPMVRRRPFSYIFPTCPYRCQIRRSRLYSVQFSFPYFFTAFTHSLKSLRSHFISPPHWYCCSFGLIYCLPGLIPIHHSYFITLMFRARCPYSSFLCSVTG